MKSITECSLLNFDKAGIKDQGYPLLKKNLMTTHIFIKNQRSLLTYGIVHKKIRMSSGEESFKNTHITNDKMINAYL
jgi:hypothetical protein